ncbi:hypothetical protein JR316_0000900 [Psilocybe cubensis]|uniref:Uncharacterized protein n=2 Tax=Psilocybe cubensis TaxID=181762 RepID=A0ACB8HGL1_PSICU|nr:hypothetical protein JR316_0000889 [Psilocybe cubensis]XP_047754460.1 hypothetical protein JR316_0000900 [Psilocybe cubensis]KAH9486824.1 hypothetical protein JR316_0000889 [Psilocybe cubensis]KAH9486835.1 hypothetical protein JR316_0000900 [Psilocybe cubensis]
MINHLDQPKLPNLPWTTLAKLSANHSYSHPHGHTHTQGHPPLLFRPRLDDQKAAGLDFTTTDLHRLDAAAALSLTSSDAATDLSSPPAPPVSYRLCRRHPSRLDTPPAPPISTPPPTPRAAASALCCRPLLAALFPLFAAAALSPLAVVFATSLARSLRYLVHTI